MFGSVRCNATAPIYCLLGVRSGKRSERAWQQERVLAVHGHGALGSSAWPSLQHADLGGRAVRKASRGCTDGLALRRAAGWVGPSPSPWVRWGHGLYCGTVQYYFPSFFFSFLFFFFMSAKPRAHTTRNQFSPVGADHPSRLHSVVTGFSTFPYVCTVPRGKALHTDREPRAKILHLRARSNFCCGPRIRDARVKKERVMKEA